MSYFETLNKVNVNKMTEQKNGLTYLSWALAWQELKKHYPLSFYTVYESASGMNYHTDGRTCWVKTGVTVVDKDMELEHIEYLPVMDYRNKSIPVDMVTSFDVNKAIQRSLTKAIARHGLGLYIYAGEDLPNEKDDERRNETNERIKSAPNSYTSNTAKKLQEAKKGYIERCKSLNIDPILPLQQVGWTKQQGAATQDQYDKASVLLDEIEEANVTD